MCNTASSPPLPSPFSPHTHSDVIDVVLPDTFISLVQQTLMLVGIVITACVSSFFFIIPLIPALLLLVYVQHIFRKSSTQLKRVESSAFSFVFQAFGAAHRGAESIRAHSLQASFLNQNAAMINRYNKVFIVYQLLQRWLAMRLDSIGTLFIISVGFVLVLARHSISPEIAGLAVVYSLQMMGLLQFTVRLYIIVEGSMTAVERLNMFSSLSAEAQYRTDDDVEGILKNPSTKQQAITMLSGRGASTSHSNGVFGSPSSSSLSSSSSSSPAVVSLSSGSRIAQRRAQEQTIRVASSASSASSLDESARAAEVSTSSSSNSLVGSLAVDEDPHALEPREKLLQRLGNWPWAGTIEFKVSVLPRHSFIQVVVC